MKIFHASDLHYCSKHLDDVDRAFTYAVNYAIEVGADAAVISGDSFDSAIGIHEPAVTALFTQVYRLAQHMPVLVLQGTFSHDRPGSLSPLWLLGGAFPVLVADTSGQWALTHDRRWSSDLATPGARAVFSALPSLNKAALPDSPAAYVADLMTQFRENVPKGLPSILVSHGTVSGCVTESKHAMISPDHEFHIDTLFSSGADAIMLGHIHAHQSWRQGGQAIAYPGSITRLIYGHRDPTGFLLWNIEPGRAEYELVETPAPGLIEITFDGPPSMAALRELADQVGENDRVRIRYEIDQDHAHTVDRSAIEEMFGAAGGVKVEATVHPVQSVRASGIGRAMTLREKLGYWATTTGDEDRLGALEERLGMLQWAEPEEIAEQILGEDESKQDQDKEAA